MDHVPDVFISFLPPDMTFHGRSYQAPLGLAAAVSTSVGNALGSGDGNAAKRAAAIGAACAVLLQAAIASGVVLLAAKPLVSAAWSEGTRGRCFNQFLFSTSVT